MIVGCTLVYDVDESFMVVAVMRKMRKNHAAALEYVPVVSVSGLIA